MVRRQGTRAPNPVSLGPRRALLPVSARKRCVTRRYAVAPVPRVALAPDVSGQGRTVTRPGAVVSARSASGLLSMRRGHEMGGASTPGPGRRELLIHGCVLNGSRNLFACYTVDLAGRYCRAGGGHPRGTRTEHGVTAGVIAVRAALQKRVVEGRRIHGVSRGTVVAPPELTAEISSESMSDVRGSQSVRRSTRILSIAEVVAGLDVQQRLDLREGGRSSRWSACGCQQRAHGAGHRLLRPRELFRARGAPRVRGRPLRDGRAVPRTAGVRTEFSQAAVASPRQAGLR